MLHFGHYKFSAYSYILSKMQALKLSLITRTGLAPDRWARSCQLFQKKVASIALVTKLRVILLMEAHFNYHNRMIFGSLMMNLARQHSMVLEEVFSEKGKTAEDAILQQILPSIP